MLLLKLSKHTCGLYLQHNACKDMYETVAQMLNSNENFYGWQNEKSKQKAVDTNEIWTLQWYPDTPIGCYAIAAPTLKELMDYLEKEFKDFESFDIG